MSAAAAPIRVVLFFSMLVVLAAARLLALIGAARLAAGLTAAIGLLAALLLTLTAVLSTLPAMLRAAFVAGALVALRHVVGIALRRIAIGHECLLSMERLGTARFQGRAAQTIHLSAFGEDHE
jgi:energy-converting hydrogenase Eha subunit B